MATFKDNMDSKWFARKG